MIEINIVQVDGNRLTFAEEIVITVVILTALFFKTGKKSGAV